MNPSLPQTLDEWREALVHAETRLAEAQADVDAIRKVVDGMAAYAARRDHQSAGGASANHERAVAAAPEDDRPRGVEAIRRLLQEDRHRSWSIAELVEEMARRGWVDPTVQHPGKAAATAMLRLVQKYAEAERVERGRYRLRSSDAEETPTTEENSS